MTDRTLDDARRGTEGENPRARHTADVGSVSSPVTPPSVTLLGAS